MRISQSIREKAEAELNKRLTDEEIVRYYVRTLNKMDGQELEAMTKRLMNLSDEFEMTLQ